MKNLRKRLIFSADCSQSMGLPPELKIRRFENLFLFFLFSRSSVTFVQNPKLSKIQNPKLNDPPPYYRDFPMYSLNGPPPKKKNVTPGRN
jgi:hypothetical protein